MNYVDIRHFESAFEPDDDGFEDELECRVFASLFRVLELAPIEKRLQIFSLIMRFAADQIAARRQRDIDDLWAIADDIGLIELHGVTYVQNAFVTGFRG
jgi:hypothetical protein